MLKHHKRPISKNVKERKKKKTILELNTVSGTILGGERNREINGWIAIAMAMRDERRKTKDFGHECKP